MVVPETLLERAAEIQALAGHINTHEKALGDCANRSRELEAQKEVTAELREQLGSAAPEHPAPVDRALRTSIAKLGDEQVKLLERKRVAEEHLQECNEANDQAARALKDDPASPEAPDAIATWTAATAEQVPLALAAAKQKSAADRAIAKLVATAAAAQSALRPSRPPTRRASTGSRHRRAPGEGRGTGYAVRRATHRARPPRTPARPATAAARDARRRGGREREKTDGCGPGPA